MTLNSYKVHFTLYLSLSLPVANIIRLKFLSCTCIHMHTHAAGAADLVDTSNIEVCIPAGNPASATITIDYHRTEDDSLVEPSVETFTLLLIPDTLAPQFASTTVSIMDNDQGMHGGCTQNSISSMRKRFIIKLALKLI